VILILVVVAVAVLRNNVVKHRQHAGPALGTGGGVLSRGGGG
jgi:hypothetical protein